MMAQNFPKDAFDSVTDAGGRHRAKRTLASRFVSFSRYAAVSAALSAAAIVALNFNSDTSVFSGTLGTQTTTQTQSFNSGGVGVTVIDATETNGLATKVAQKLFDSGWNVLSAVNQFAPGATIAKPGFNLDGTPIAPAAVTPETTVIYASSAASESAAQKVMKELGSYQVVISANYVDPVTIVLGSDFR
jgi:hypothetical protein